jgi:uncharacterized protein YcbK (DUF882 family)
MAIEETHADAPADRRRRTFVTSGLASLGLLIAAQRVAQAMAPANPRRLGFENLHTGDRLEIAYWNDGRLQADALSSIEWTLRDHRNNATHPIDTQLLDLLFALKGELGVARPYQVISGYRSPESNAMLASLSDGVARHSLHTQGMAIDIRVEGVPLERLRDAAKSLRAGGVGYYPRSDFVHADVGRVRYW